jgi:cobalt/nickel transport system permease protein
MDGARGPARGDLKLDRDPKRLISADARRPTADGPRTADPRTALALALALAAAALSGPRGAAVAAAGLSAWLVWLRAPARILAARFLPLAGAFAVLAAVALLVDRHAAGVAARGFLVSAAAVAAGLTTTWPRLLGVLAALRCPPAALAFLAVTARHAATLRDEVQQVVRTLAVRGAMDGFAASWRGLRVLLVRTLPLAMDRADRVSDALALRGFAGRFAALRPWRLARVEAPLYAIAAVLAGAAAWEVLA